MDCLPAREPELQRVELLRPMDQRTGYPFFNSSHKKKDSGEQVYLLLVFFVVVIFNISNVIIYNYRLKEK